MTLIGVGHVFAIEPTIRSAIAALRPDAVCVELDHGRLQGLLQRRRGDPMPQVRGNMVQKRLMRFQESVAKRYGGQVGGEMVAAVEGAQQVAARLFLIDQRADVTLRRALRELTWRERMRIAAMVLGAPFKRLFGHADVDVEVAKYQADPLAALTELEDKFPTVHRVVIQERDALMANRVRRVSRDHGHTVVIVGDGHVPGMSKHLEGLQVTAYRLGDVREGRLPKPAVGQDFHVGFDVDYRT